MKTIKLLCPLFLAATAFGLTGCDIGGGDADTTLYHLSISYSENVASKAAFKQVDLKAVFAFGPDADITERPAEDVEDYLSAGASQEDIDKTGVRQDDGTYYFFDSDPIKIETPVVEGYYVEGFYDKATNERLFSPLVDRWNMKAKDLEIEVRYEVLQYNITYCYACDYSGGPSGEIPAGENPNPATYNYESNPQVTLAAPTGTFAGFEFVEWFQYSETTRQYTKFTELPKTLDEEFIHPVSYVGDKPVHGLTLFAKYDYQKFDVTFNVAEQIGTTKVTVNILDHSGSPEQIIVVNDLPIELIYNYQVDLQVDISEIAAPYEFDGVYVNSVKVPDIEPNRPDNHPIITITADTSIEVKVKLAA